MLRSRYNKQPPHPPKEGLKPLLSIRSYFEKNILFKLSWFLLLSPLWGAGGLSCSKDKNTYNDTPSIELNKISAFSIHEGDSLSFSISYSDGDGDLGENNPEAKNLFLTDNRVNVTYQYRIQQLAPTDAHIIIRGTLSVILNSTAITDSSSSQQVIYSIYVKDRAGHQSNTVTSPAITINK